MYIPKSFQFSDKTEIAAFMRRYPFATVVTAHDGVPLATHLPFAVEEHQAGITLSSHFAATNNQSRLITGCTSLVIFSEPHAYISPRHYDKLESVPTWDYIAVHAYGTCRVVEDHNAKLALLEKMIGFYEPEYLNQWTSLPLRFKTGMMSGIVAFTMDVAELQGQQKLSQNKTPAERMRIVKQLETTAGSVEQALADYIRKTIT